MKNIENFCRICGTSPEIYQVCTGISKLLNCTGSYSFSCFLNEIFGFWRLSSRHWQLNLQTGFSLCLPNDCYCLLVFLSCDFDCKLPWSPCFCLKRLFLRCLCSPFCPTYPRPLKNSWNSHGISLGLLGTESTVLESLFQLPLPSSERSCQPFGAGMLGWRQVQGCALDPVVLMEELEGRRRGRNPPGSRNPHTGAWTFTQVAARQLCVWDLFGASIPVGALLLYAYFCVIFWLCWSIACLFVACFITQQSHWTHLIFFFFWVGGG